MARVHNVECAVAHNDGFFAWPRPDNRAEFIDQFDFGAELSSDDARVLHEVNLNQVAGAVTSFERRRRSSGPAITDPTSIPIVPATSRCLLIQGAIFNTIIPAFYCDRKDGVRAMSSLTDLLQYESLNH
jgi:hypothetical protein